MNLQFNIEPGEFQERKRRRISTMNTAAAPPPKVAPTSAPGVHEVATFLPGRLEFEHELDNDAEDLVKDLEFGVCLEYGGDQIMEDENDQDVRARLRWEEERRTGSGPLPGPEVKAVRSGKGPPANGLANGVLNGYHTPVNGKRDSHSQAKSDDVSMENGTNDGDTNADEVTQPPPFETKDSLTFKLTLLEMYGQRVEKRLESKAIMFDRGLLEYKKVCEISSFPWNLHPIFFFPDASCREKTSQGGEGYCTSTASIC